MLKAAFEQFPRLGTFQEQEGDVLFKGWPSSVRGQTLFHNELMRCCRVSLRQLSQKRAQFHEGRPPPTDSRANSAAGSPAQSRPLQGARADDPCAASAPPRTAPSASEPGAGAASQGLRAFAPSTPPGGVEALEF